MFLDVSGQAFNTLHPTDFSYFERINELVQEEPSSAQDPEVLGLLASIGIEKDKRFAPDARMKAILEDAAAVGNATARALLFAPRDEEAALYDDRHWQRLVTAGGHEFLTEFRQSSHRYAGAVSQLRRGRDPEQ